jgi:hypothetical protein
MKAKHFHEVKKFSDIPNIGPAMVRDFQLLKLKSPKDLIGKDPLKLYKKICKVTGVHQDPCVLDTYMAAIDFMNGADARPWFSYTAERKNKYPNI